MILRLVIGAVLTVALVSVTAPALSTAQADSADAEVDRQLRALSDRLETMVATDDPTTGPGARRIAEIRLPAETQTTAEIVQLRFHSHEDVGVATWRVDDAGGDSMRLVGVPLRPTGGELVLEEPGVHRLAFEFRLQDGTAIVTVQRLSRASNRNGSER